MSTRQKAKNWIFTLNNPSDASTDNPTTWTGVHGLKYQLEVGESGTPHFQGVVQFDKRLRLSALKKICPRAHWEVCKSLKAQIKYCGKEDGRIEGPFTFGSFTHMGTRTDLEAAKAALDADTPMETMWQDQFPSMVRHSRAFREYKRLCTPARKQQTKCDVYWGDTGIGKSTYLADKYPKAYWHHGDNWFDDYDGHEVVIMEDFFGQLPIRTLLRLIDHTPHRVAVKFGYVQWTTKLLIITCNKQVANWYGDIVPEPVKKALYRRIDHIYTRDDYSQEWEDIKQYAV